MSRPIWQVCGKRIPEEEAEAQSWIEQVIGERFPPGLYEDALRDGIILCKLINTLYPGVIKRINVAGGDYKFMDNIQQFLAAATAYGVADVDLFQSVDLITKKDIATVTMCIFAVARAAYRHPEWSGPFLGPRPADENLRNFSEDVLRDGKLVIGLQAGSNKGASQAGQNLGAQRRIILGK